MYGENSSPIQFDHHYTSRTKFGMPLVDPTFTLALVTGQSVTDASQNVFVNLSLGEVGLPNPVFEGDTIYSRSEVLEKRESKSRPNVGIGRVETMGFNQDATPVVTFVRKMMVYKKDWAPKAARVTPGELAQDTSERGERTTRRAAPLAFTNR